ncbi:MAG: ABC transporter ATP-binding protein [Lachnospiraceae bacterium]|nr:ABC transporter ATP-binding protein [Lachnospiraceae bacterium]
MFEQEYYFQTEHLTVGYDGVPIVSDMEICLKRGEILTLIGPNGAGKTTVLRSIIRQLRPIAGVVMIHNMSMEKISAAELSRQMAVVLTDRLRTEMMTVRDVVGTGRYPYTGKFGILSKKDHQIVEDAMKLTKIMDIREQIFTKISDGQRQRVMLARALAQQPDIILLDEPTSFLDIKHKLEFLSIIQRLSREKKLTVIMSLHEVELARKISDKIACFKDGVVDRCGRPEEIFTEHYLSELYDIELEELTPDFQEVVNTMDKRGAFYIG